MQPINKVKYPEKTFSTILKHNSMYLFPVGTGGDMGGGGGRGQGGDMGGGGYHGPRGKMDGGHHGPGVNMGGGGQGPEGY